MGEYSEIYPSFKKDEKAEKVSGANFRLSSVSGALDELKCEVKHYEKVRNKYAKAPGILAKTSIATGVFSVALSASGLGTSLTRLGALIGIPLGEIGGILGLTSVACSTGAKKLTRGLSKHDQTVALVKGKKSTVSDLVSKAFTDGKISDVEFSLVLNEVTKYEKSKAALRRKWGSTVLAKKGPNAEGLAREPAKQDLALLITNALTPTAPPLSVQGR